MSIIEELRRRNVFRVGIAYVVITWLLLQVADVVTSEGLKKEKDVDRSQPTAPNGHKLDLVIYGLMGVALVYFAWDKFLGGAADDPAMAPATPATAQLDKAASAEPAATPANQPAATAPDARSIAVLPFVDMSPEGDQQYLSDGIAEELLNLLVQIPDLKVAARTSSFSFKGENVKIDEVASELHVAHVLEGSVRKAGNRVRITAQLIKADDGYHLWSETFDRTLDDVFAIQDEISAAVVAALKVRLLGEAPKSVEVNPQAYALYLQGRYLFGRRTQTDWENAALAFEQALGIEPDYAAAWAGLSLVLGAQAGQSYRELHAGYVLAREAANKALELDPNLAEAHTALGKIQMSYDWDWAGAETSLTRALELAPGNSHILAEMAVLQRFIGNLDASIELNRRAVELDPLALAGYHQLGLALIWAEQSDEALAVYQHLLTLNPEYTSANLSLSRILLIQGSMEAAMAAAEREQEPFWREFGILINLYAQGRGEEGDPRLVDFIEQNQADSAYQIATIYGFRGDIDQVFEWLELAYAQRDGGLPEMLSDPFLNQFSNDPRWVEVLKKVGLYEAWLRVQA